MTEIALVTNVGACRVGSKAALSPRLRFRCPSLHAGYRLTDNKYSQSSASVLFALPDSPLTQFVLSPSKYACLYLQLVVKQTYVTNTQHMFKHCLPPVGQIRLPFVCFAMEKVGFVQFRNVGCSYFPESRVDCHYTLSSQHNWASSDWIGLFKVPLTHQLAQKSKSISALLPKKQKNPTGCGCFPSSGRLVIGEGLPHVCLGAGPA